MKQSLSPHGLNRSLTDESLDMLAGANVKAIGSKWAHNIVSNQPKSMDVSR